MQAINLARLFCRWQFQIPDAESERQNRYKKAGADFMVFEI